MVQSSSARAAWPPAPIPPFNPAAPYRSGRLRVRWVVATQAALLVGLLLQVAVIIEVSSLVGGGVHAPEEYESARSLSTVADLVFLVAQVAAFIALIAWLSRMVENTPALGGGLPATSPRMSIFWWFIPVANFVIPYRIVADVRRRLAGGSGETWWAGLGWWATFVAGTIVERAGILMVGGTDSPRTFMNAAGIVFIGLVLLMGSAGLAIVVVREIGRLERERVAASPYPLLASTVWMPSPRLHPVYCPRCGYPGLPEWRACPQCRLELAPPVERPAPAPGAIPPVAGAPGVAWGAAAAVPGGASQSATWPSGASSSPAWPGVAPRSGDPGTDWIPGAPVVASALALPEPPAAAHESERAAE